MPGAVRGLGEGTSHSGGWKIRKGFLKEGMLERSLEGWGAVSQVAKDIF